MNSSSNFYSEDSKSSYHSRANTTQRGASESPQVQDQTDASRDTTLYHNSSQMQQPQATSRANRFQSHQPTAINPSLSSVYAPSTYAAHQGSRETNNYADTPGAQDRVNFPGAKHSPIDPKQRVGQFVHDQELGAPYGSSVEAERNGINRGAVIVSHFNLQFFGAANTDTPAHNAHSDAGSLTDNRNSNVGCSDYPSTIGDNGQYGSSSRTKR